MTTAGRDDNPGQQENLAIAKRLFDEIWNRHQTQVLDEIMSPDHELLVGTERIDGIERFRDALHGWFRGFPDMHFYIEDLIAQADKVVVRWSARGTHQGVFMGIAPTGKEVNYWGINIIDIRRGRIIRQWGTADWEDLIASLTNRKPHTLSQITGAAA